MADRPQVYKTNKIKSLEHFRERYEKGSAREHTKLAIEHARAMHDLLMELANEVRALTNAVNEMVRRQNG